MTHPQVALRGLVSQCIIDDFLDAPRLNPRRSSNCQLGMEVPVHVRQEHPIGLKRLFTRPHTAGAIEHPPQRTSKRSASHKFTIGDRIENTALDVLDMLIEATLQGTACSICGKQTWGLRSCASYRLRRGG